MLMLIRRCGFPVHCRQLAAAFAADRLHQQLRKLNDLSDETTAMMRVLQEFGYVDSSGQGGLVSAQ